MSRVHTSRALIPRLSKDNNELEIWTTCGPADEFDPVITGVACDWYFDDGYTERTASGANLAGGHYHFASAGPHRVICKPVGGLAAITAISAADDLLTKLKNVRKCRIRSITIHNSKINAIYLSDFPNATYLSLRGSVESAGSAVIGDLSSLNREMTHCSMSNTTITGSLADLPATAQTVYLILNSYIIATSIAHLVAIQDLRIYSMGWLTAGVDTVLLSVSDAIHANVNHFTYATPALNIGGTNEAPSGTYVDPLITPGTGSTDSNWEWDAVAGKHKALTGMAAVWVMTHNTGHVWTVTVAGGAPSYPIFGAMKFNSLYNSTYTDVV